MNQDIIPRAKMNVRSDEDPNTFYTVDKVGDQWTCNCPARQSRDFNYFCKHILRVEKVINSALQERAKDTAPPKLRKAVKKHGSSDKPLVVGEMYDFGSKALTFPRVTSILSECKNPNSLIKWAARMAATALKTDDSLSIEEAELAPFHFRSQKAKIGTNVHDFVELFNAGEKAEEHIKDLQPAERPYAYAFLNWINKTGPENITSLDAEKPVYSKKYKYAGKFDWIAAIHDKVWLLDIKTSKYVFEEYGLQLAAYKQAILEMNLIEKIDGMAIIHLKPDMTFAFVEVDEPLKAFLAMREVWAWRYAKKNGGEEA